MIDSRFEDCIEQSLAGMRSNLCVAVPQAESFILLPRLYVLHDLGDSSSVIARSPWLGRPPSRRHHDRPD
jgi:hypothetical protein